MIAYNSKAWFTFIFRIHRFETLRSLAPLLVAITAYAAFIAYGTEFIALYGYKEGLSSLSALYSALGFVLSLLLVFRTNTAYDRWWEGRKLWGGLVNVTRNLALEGASLARDLPAGDGTGDKYNTFLRHFPRALMFHLREQRFEMPSDQELHAAVHQPLFISQGILQCIEKMSAAAAHGDLRILRVVPLQQELMNICGACERIKNTPIPFIYSVFLKKFVFLYVMFFPWVFTNTMHGFCVPATAFVLYVFATLELIAEEIENPFNGDPSDLPLEQLCEVMGRSVDQLDPNHGNADG